MHKRIRGGNDVEGENGCDNAGRSHWTALFQLMAVFMDPTRTPEIWGPRYVIRPFQN